MQAVTLEDVKRARAASDPLLAQLVVRLAADAEPHQAVRDGALTWDRRPSRQDSDAFRALTPEQRHAQRTAEWAALTSPDAEHPLPERFHLHTVVLELDDDGGAWAREQLLQIIASVPLKWGPWKALKTLFKRAEERGDRELYGALLARFDVAFSRNHTGEIRKATLRYLVRRGWRTLRTAGQLLPSTYPDAASEVLRHYPEHTNFRNTWVANHIFHHELSVGGKPAYTRARFKTVRSRGANNRAFSDAWRRSPRPLFSLLQRAQCEEVRRFAASSLKTDFRTQLREVEAPWVARLIAARSASVDSFVVWLLDAVPRFEPGALGELGLHEPVLSLLDSEAADAAGWAATYVRTHARDLPLDRLVELMGSSHKSVRSLARDLLKERDPRTEVGLDAWGRLLDMSHGHSLAATALREHFTASELTLEWFTERLLSTSKVASFAAELLTKVYAKGVPTSLYTELLDHRRGTSTSARIALDALELGGLDEVDDTLLRRLALNPHTSRRLERWVRDDRVAATRLGAPFFKGMVDEALWNALPTVVGLASHGAPWAAELRFDPGRRSWAIGLLSDARTFSADDLGFTWLFDLVQRTDATLHAFARTTLTRSFHPSHFADPEDRAAAPETEAAPEDADLQQKSFVFTGKLATMTRSQAQKMVAAANGRKGSAVNAKLDFLVIGDEGSPLYGGGRKGSKQVKAEGLIEKGSAMKIISETAFLQMLAGESVEVDEDAALAGCERLWTMLVSPGAVDAPLRAFALHYLRQHHAEIHMAETDRPLDPGAELPPIFLTFERAALLCADSRAPLRELGLLWMTWELAKWSPPMADIVSLCELPHGEVRAFVELALTADDSRRHRRYRLDPALLTPDAVYRFCESHDHATRALGMKLIGDHPRLAIPEELFRLTESPDRSVRAFVIRQLWSLYRDTGASSAWTAPERTGEEPRPGRPEAWPAAHDDVRSFLRRTMFGIPPARLPKTGGSSTFRKLPAWRAKVALIDVCRDLALEDRDFAVRIHPLLREFMASTGKRESEACLVALTRIGARYGDLGGAA